MWPQHNEIEATAISLEGTLGELLKHNVLMA